MPSGQTEAFRSCTKAFGIALRLVRTAYAAMAVAVYMMIRCALFGMAWRYALIPAAFLAGVLLHARPHMAVGLYAGVVAMIGLVLWQETKRARVHAVTSLAVLGLIGLSFLQLNTARFGFATAAHGQIEAPGETSTAQYGPVFFGSDYAISGRGLVFVEHGRFHPWRVLPNAMIYTLDFPVGSAQIAALHRQVTEGISGYGHIERPYIGMLFMWPMWITLMTVALTAGLPRISGGLRTLPLLVATGLAAGFMLSYPTVAFRYRFDVWPFIMALCLLGFPGLIGRFGTNFLQSSRVFLVSTIFLMGGAFVSGHITIIFKQSYQAGPGFRYGPWDAEMCLAQLAGKAFSPARLVELCVDPDSVFEQRKRG